MVLRQSLLKFIACPLLIAVSVPSFAAVQCYTNFQMAQFGVESIRTSRLLFWQAREAQELAISVVRLPESGAAFFKLMECSLPEDAENRPSSTVGESARFCAEGNVTELGELWIPAPTSKPSRDAEGEIIFDLEDPFEFFLYSIRETIVSKEGAIKNAPLADLLAENTVELSYSAMGVLYYFGTRYYPKKTRGQRLWKWLNKGVAFSGIATGGYVVASRALDKKVMSEKAERARALEELIGLIDSERSEQFRFDGSDRSRNLERSMGYDLVKEAFLTANNKTKNKFCGESLGRR